MDKVGDKASKTGDKIEHSSGRAGKAFGLLGKTFASSSAGALGPLQELTDKMEVFTQATEGGSSKAAGRIFGLGLAATAAGSFIESLHSREQAAQQQLSASIETTGHSYEEYAGRVEGAVKSGEHFGNQASTTMDALNRLVTTTHNPEEAFKGLGVAIDAAAEKHIPLKNAAELVGLAFNGSTRAGKQFGLQLENVTGAAKGLDAAQKASVTATTAVKNAQTTYTEKLDLWNNSSTKTRAGAYALRDAHTKLLEAQDKASAAAARLKTAQEKAAEASGAGARNVQKLADVVKGQGAAAADTFTGHLKALGAQLEDTLGAQGKLGGALVTGGVLASGIGALASAGAFGALGRLLARIGLTGTSFKTLRNIEIASSAEGAAGVVAGAATAETALVAEGEVAVATAGRIRTAFAGLATLPLLGVGAFPDVKMPPHPGLTNKQFDELNSKDVLGGKNFGKISTADLSAMLAYLNSFKTLDGSLGKVKQSLVDILNVRNPKQTVLTDAQQLAKALNSDNPNVATHAQQGVAKALDGAKKTAGKSGKDSGDAYLKALLGQIGSDQAAQAAKDAAVKNAQAIVDAISGVFQAAQSRLQGLVSASMGLRQSVTSALQGGSALTDIFQGPNLNANGAFGAQNNFGRVKDFLQRRVAQERKFVLELRQLMKQGLDPSLVAQIAQAGVGPGQQIAESLLSGGKAGIGQVNSLERQIASLANTTGKSVADQHYAKQIAEQRRTTEILGAELKESNRRLAAIQNNTAGTRTSTSAHLRTTAALSGV